MSLRKSFTKKKQVVITDNIVTETQLAERKQKRIKTYNMVIVGLVCMMTAGMCFATDPAKAVVQQMINIIVKVFRYIGVVLAVYSIGQLVMAFKNEDADSKSRATTMLVISCILIGIKTIVDSLNLTSYLD